MTAILDHRGKPIETRPAPARPRNLRARYDAAQTTPENRAHWQWADFLSARAAHDPYVRRTLRIRNRYEIANSPLARGILKKLADFTVGTGPRLQVGTDNPIANAVVQEKWYRWCVAVAFFRKLWLMRFDKAQNGESFALFFNNGGMPGPVKLDVRLVEADQIADPTASLNTDPANDGLIFDDWGNVIGYRMLKAHPGDTFFTFDEVPGQSDTIPARDMAHYFSPDRPGQIRGVPETTSALPLFAMRRRFVLATIGAAEVAANAAGVIHSSAPPAADDDDDAVTGAFDSIELERGSFLTLPAGWDINQLKAEHPSTTFEMFDNAIIRELARCVNMSYGIAASDSSDYNFASGKLDHLPFFRSINIEQDHLEDVMVEKAFAKWYAEASRIPGYLPLDPAADLPPHQWFWDGQEFLDPREAGANDIALKNGSMTLPRLYAKRGLDIDTEHAADAKCMGMTLDAYKAALRDTRFAVPGAPAVLTDVPADDEEQPAATAKENQ